MHSDYSSIALITAQLEALVKGAFRMCPP